MITILLFVCTLAYAQHRELAPRRIRPSRTLLHACQAILDHVETLELRENDLVVMCDHLKRVYEHACD